MKSVIIVFDRHMKPVEGAKVVLGFPWGMSQKVYTDSEGQAEIEHSSPYGNTAVYINGSMVETIDTPRLKKIYLK